MEKITVRNNFHGTDDCDCGGELGERGPQEFIRIDLHQFDDGDRWYIV